MAQNRGARTTPKGARGRGRATVAQPRGQGGNANFVKQFAPSAFSTRISTKGPKVLQAEGGIRVIHSEMVCDLRNQVAVRALPVDPESLRWLAGLAQNYQNFMIKKWNVRYVPRSATDLNSKVIMAPYYNSKSPFQPFHSTSAAFSAGLDVLPGSVSVAGWAESSVQWLARKAIRAAFKFFGGSGPTAETASAQIDDEARMPGHVLVETGGSGTTIIGSVWVDYDVILYDEVLRARGFGLAKAATDDTALALESGTVVGERTHFICSGNKVAFMAAGIFTVILKYIGTDPVSDTDGHLLTDAGGSDVTALRFINAYDVSSAAYDGVMTSDDQGLSVESATESLHVMMVNVNVGDILTIDALTSGTITNILLYIIRGGTTSTIRT